MGKFGWITSTYGCEVIVTTGLEHLEHIEGNAPCYTEQQDGIGVAEDRITIRSGLGDQFGPNDTASPGAIVDDDALPVVIAQHLGGCARNGIGPRTRRNGYDQPYRPRRVVPRPVLRQGHATRYE